MFTVLFVCTGNTCRSPMAETWFRHLVEDADLDITVHSAGTHGIDGDSASNQARLAVADEGLSLEGFRSSGLTAGKAADADLIIGMTQSHLNQLKMLDPDLADKACTLLSLTGSDADISDPFGMDTAVYKNCLKQMKPALQALLEKIKLELNTKE